MAFSGRTYPTLIGSFPGSEHKKALDYILRYCPEIPCWPQLPAHPQEGMLVQFSRGLPGFDPQRLSLDPGHETFEKEMLAFYEEYLAVKEGQKPFAATRFALKEDDAPGLFMFKERLKEAHPAPVAVKGQITGPFTLAVGLKTKEGKAAFYDPTLRDLITKNIALKAAFQVEFLKDFGVPVIIFLDEPALSGFGSSSFVGVNREEVLQVIQEVVEEIRGRGGIPGVHVCANTEWDLLIEAGLDILNFDAFDYLDRFLLYEAPLKDFLNQGGNIAWGIVPTLKPEVLKETRAEALTEKLEEALERLSQQGLSKGFVLEKSLITPSCGMGTLPEELVPHALSLLREVATKLRP